MKVRFKPLHGQDSVSVPDLLDEDGNPIYFDTSEHAERDLSDADAAIALSNPNFVIASTGKNPNVEPAPIATPAPVAPPIVAPARGADSSEV